MVLTIEIQSNSYFLLSDSLGVLQIYDFLTEKGLARLEPWGGMG